LLILVPIGISYLILWNYEESEESIEALVLQPNVNPYTEKYNTNDARIGELLLRLAEDSLTPETRVVIAPETVFADGTPFSRFNSSQAGFYSREFVDRHPEKAFLSGIAFYDRFDDPARVRRQSNQI